MYRSYRNANEAYEGMLLEISNKGMKKENTLFLNNVMVEIKNPLDNLITNKQRKWNHDYAEFEWQWYLSGNRNVSEIGKRASIWNEIANENNEVNSNYGYQWKRNSQIDYVISELKRNKLTRRAVLTIYDAKEHVDFNKDTPCTLSISFNVVNQLLNMTVNMRSNDLIFGFCNDQYCFSKLQEMVSVKTGIPIGTYFHIANDLHIYERHFKLLP